MIERLDISGVHFEVDERLHKYVTKKIGKLDAYMSRHVRKSVHGEVKLIGVKAKDKKESLCEVVLRLPHDTITVKEATTNMYASVDVVETKLRNQLKRYKELNTANHRGVRKLLAKLRSREA
jgi:ribosomal subunit interface protein